MQLGVSWIRGAGNGRVEAAIFRKKKTRFCSEFRRGMISQVRAILPLRQIPYLLVILFGMLATSLAQAPESGDTAPIPESERIHRGDVVDVDIVGSSEYDWRGPVGVSGALDGYLTPGDAIAAVCRDPKEVADSIAAAFSKVLREPRVVVRIVDRSARPLILMQGAVKTPTRFLAKRDVRLSELIVRTGGIKDNASGEITILRPAGVGCSDEMLGLTKVTISDILKGSSASNPVVVSGDIVTVDEARAVYVIGAVNNPRPVYLRNEMTLTRAIASAGGLSKDFRGGIVTIFRREGAQTTTVEVDINKIKRGESVDTVLRASDILDVAGKGGNKREFPPITGSPAGSGSRSDPPLVVIEH